MKNITFFDILDRIDMSKEEFKDLDKQYNKAIDFLNRNRNNKDVDLVKKDNHLSTVLAYSVLGEQIGDIYYNLIYKEGYFLSVEDISKNLDVSIQFAQKLATTYLERLEFPTSDYNIKTVMKNNLYNDLYEKYYREDYYLYIKLKNDFFNKFRKKVLYSSESYIDYLKNHLVIEEANKNISLILEEKYFFKFKDIFKKISNEEIIKKLFNDFLNSKKEEMEESKYKDIFDFEKMIKFKYDFFFKLENISKDDDIEKYAQSYFKSMSTLKVIFDKVYDIEIYRILKNENVDIMEFTLYTDLEKKKKPSKRYYLDKEFLIDKFKESLEEENVEEIIEEREIIEEGFIKVNLKIPRTYYIMKYKNKEKLKKEFIDFINFK